MPSKRSLRQRLQIWLGWNPRPRENGPSEPFPKDSTGSPRVIPTSVAEDGRERAEVLPPPANSALALAPPKRWVDESFSPYGYVDDNGGLQQLDSQNWRRAFGKKSGRFVPKSATVKNRSVGLQASSTGNGFVWKIMIAGLVLAAGFYLHQTHVGTIQRKVWTGYEWTMTTDDTGKVTPYLRSIASKLHWTLPTFGAQAVMALHDPMSGTMLHDFSAQHPQVDIQGQSYQTVQSAGSGNVLAVSRVGHVYLVEIQSSPFGRCVYVGLGSVSIQKDQYVYAGQVIGRLPKEMQPPVLQFSLLHDGKFENPNDYIRFPENS